jgi:predicted PurR-regulated permease PerM
LFDKFAEVTRATMKGTLVVGLVQGTLGGLLFWILGLQAAIFWGVIMTLLSLLPAVGSALVWAPAAIILLATGHIVKGIILLAAGGLIIGLIDNLLRPMLVGRHTQIPDYLILLATLGGLTVFGLSGFVIGPIIAALFLAVWDMFAQEYSHEDAAPPFREVPSPPDHVAPALPDHDDRSTAP